MNQEPIFDMIHFYWGDNTSQTTLTLHDRTLADAIAIAKEFGFREWCWYRLSTWRNHYVAIADKMYL